MLAEWHEDVAYLNVIRGKIAYDEGNGGSLRTLKQVN